MKSTGNAGGNHNLILEPETSIFPGDPQDGRGFWSPSDGQGVNLVTGDYPRRGGFW